MRQTTFETRAVTAQTHAHRVVSRYTHCYTTLADPGTHVSCFLLICYVESFSQVLNGWRDDHGRGKI